MDGIVGLLKTYYGYIESLGYVIFCLKGAITMLKDVNNNNFESCVTTLLGTGGKFAIFCTLPDILLQIKNIT